MKYSKTYGIIGALCIILTAMLSFMYTRDWHGVTGAALLFMIFSEVVLFGGLIFLDIIAEKTSQIVSRIGIGNTIVVYSILTFISSLIFMISFKDSVKAFATIQIIFVIAASIAGVMFFTISKNRKEKDDRVLSTVSFVRYNVERLNILGNAMQDEVNKKMLLKIAENLKYSDSSLNADVDSEIEISIADLELANAAGRDREEMEAIIKKLNQLITSRKSQIRLAKHGGI